MTISEKQLKGAVTFPEVGISITKASVWLNIAHVQVAQDDVDAIIFFGSCVTPKYEKYKSLHFFPRKRIVKPKDIDVAVILNKEQKVSNKGHWPLRVIPDQPSGPFLETNFMPSWRLSRVLHIYTLGKSHFIKNAFRPESIANAISKGRIIYIKESQPETNNL